jgi:hypothetical protein
LYLAGVIAVLPLLKALSLLVPALCNNFAFLVLKPRVPADLFPWLAVNDGRVTLNRAWLQARYNKQTP